MKVKITKFKVKENSLNEVTSEKLFKPRRCRDKDGNWRFHEKGIFSKEIFGSLYTCQCGKVTTPGDFCTECNTRVVSKNNMPDFYISCNIDVPFINTDYSIFKKESSNIEKLLTYKAFLYKDEEVIDFNLDNLNIEDYDINEVKIGKEACLALNCGVTEEWLENNTFKNIPIPHPIYRPIIETNNNNYVLTEMNEILIDLLTKRSQILSFHKYSEGDPFKELALSNLLYEKYMEVNDSIYNMFLNGKKGTIKKEIIGQSITGAIRAVITNDFSLDEDTILIGSEHASILWPNLWRRFDKDIDLINEELKDQNYYVLVNRPPTIGQKSIIAMKPQINTDPSCRFIISTNPIIFDGLAADTDGDQFLVIALYTKEANSEVKKLLPSLNYIGGNDGKIRNSIPEDFVYTMKKIYKENSSIRNKIKSIIYGKAKPPKFDDLDNGFEIDLKNMEDIPRDKYIKIYKLLGDHMWQYCAIPTVGDLVDLFDGKSNETLDDMTSFFDNEEKLKTLLSKDNAQYSNEESNKFMKQVIASNSTDISDAGWFFKKLISSCDDIRIEDEDCGSEGKEYLVENITEDVYEYKIKYSYINQLKDYAKSDYNSFIDLLKSKDIKIINVRTPMTCNHTDHRKICKKCAGLIKRSYNNYFTPKNFGCYSTLMITEHATQASLDSMNKGTSENVNTMLDRKIESKNLTLEEMREIVDDIVDEIGNIGVQARFYEIALRSRFYKNENGFYNASSLQYSFGHQDDPLGCFIYSPTKKNFMKLINAEEFEASSIKSQIMFDCYED